MAERKIRIGDLRSLILCKLCHGALVDATTIIECLHTFCKSCLVKHLRVKQNCPVCDNEVHQSEALRLNYISHDRTFQNVVNAILPNLKKNEAERERQYYALRPNIPNPKLFDGSKPCGLPPPDKPVPEADISSKVISDYHRKDAQISVQLQSKSCILKPLKRRYLRCSTLTEVQHLKKFVAAQLFDDTSRWHELDILCNDVLLGKQHNLQFVQLTQWRFRDPPLVLTYRLSELVA